MVKVKTETPEVTEKDLVEEYGEDATADIIAEKEEASKKEEKGKVVPSKEKICEFYWIQDSEILDNDNDLSKYKITKQEKAILDEWAKEHIKENIKDVTFDMYDKDDDVRAILNKYWVQPYHVAEDKLDKLWLSKEEKKIITDYYWKRAK